MTNGAESAKSVARFAGLGFLEGMIPGLRSLCSHKHPTRDARAGTPLRGYHLSPLRGVLSRIFPLTICCASYGFVGASRDASGELTSKRVKLLYV